MVSWECIDDMDHFFFMLDTYMSVKDADLEAMLTVRDIEESLR